MFLSKTKVVIVDDSPSTRLALQQCLSQLSGFRVMGVAGDAAAAKTLILKHGPDVLLLDQEMPQMDGISFLKLLMKHHPMPVVMLSEQPPTGPLRAMEALAEGALDVVVKPAREADIPLLRSELARKLKSAASSKLRARAPTDDREPALKAPIAAAAGSDRLILIGASTGGTEALSEILPRLPPGLPPIVIVQHIPADFSKAFAERLDKYSLFTVREASHGDLLRQNAAYVAPGGYHLTLAWNGRDHRLHLDRGEPIWHQRPSVDALFKSVRAEVAARSVAVILTGMGRDGAEGLLALRQAGCLTIGQDRETCAVYGMPQAAYELGAVEEQVPLQHIPATIERAVRRQRAGEHGF